MRLKKYHAYPEYQDSGIEWLGSVPSDWSLCRLKFMAKIKNGQDHKAVQVDHGYPVLGSGGQFTYASDFLYDKKSVLLGRKGTIDKPLFIDEPFWTVDTMYYTEVNKEINAKYLYYLALTIQFDRYSTNTALPSMTQEHLGNFTFAIPANSIVREKIANFLDHETIKIDDLIEKQQQLIQLLKEKRQAVISHAVTKGLNPDVPMRDSGVEWLGEVPSHWCRKSLNYLIAHTVDNRGRTPPTEDDGIPMVEVSQIAGNGFYTSENYSKFITQESYDQFVRSDVKENDILFVTVGATFGKTCLVPASPDFFIAQNVVGFRCIEDVDPKYFMFLLSSSVFKEAISATNKSSTIDNIKVSDLVKTKLVVPPYDEQLEITNHIFMVVNQYEELVSKAESFIGLMRERRTALISAAVTGKIDVRNWQAQEPSTSNTEAMA